MEQKPFCEICGKPIYFAGSGYVSESNEFLCLDCITYQRGSRDELSYISEVEKIRNSEGMIIIRR